MVTEKFDLGEVQIEALVNGSGDIIILLPGLGGDATNFNYFTPLLNIAGYKTVAINMRGIGLSKGPLVDLTLHDFANDIAGVIKCLGEKPVHVLGWAYGNRVTRCLAEDYPHLVSTVILIAAGGKVPPDEDTSKMFAKLWKPNLSGEERLKAIKFSLFSPSTDMEIIIRSMSGRKTWPEATQSQSKANIATPIDEWWNGGKAPMLVIQGTDDRMAVPENGRILKKDNQKRVKLIYLEKAGHLMIYEQPETIANKIISFISNLT
ncbi:MAG: alpha/beta hydrolase [Candidatus Lokiarchaeota archaeon]|nr:alpha/beta hydrolase [Candidatus Lokiarchaeota archaeon]